MEELMSQGMKNAEESYYCFRILLADMLSSESAALMTVRSSLAPFSANPHGVWNDCKVNHERRYSTRIAFLHDFRDQMLESVGGFAESDQNGLSINSCLAHCQTERQDTWLAADFPLIETKRIADSVEDWHFDRSLVKAIDHPYPCDKTCHHLISE